MHAILRYLTDFGDTAVTVPLAILVTAVLLIAKELRLALGWATVIIACAGLTAALKLAFRLCGYPLGDELMSPSGHTAMSFAVYGGLAALVAGNLAPRARLVVIAITALFTIGIAVSRNLAGYHSPIEVVVGLGVGLAALAALIAIVAAHRPAKLPLAWLVAGIALVFALFHGTRWPAEQALHRLAQWLALLRPLCG